MTLSTSNSVMRATLAQIDNSLTEGQSLILSDRGEGLFTVVSNVAANGLDVLAIPGSNLTLQLVIGDSLNAYMFGFIPGTNGTSPIENRELFTRMYKCCEGRSITIHTPDEDFTMDASQPVIVGADTTTRWGQGVLTAVLELPLAPASSALQTGLDRFICYGGVFATGDLATGYRYSGTYAPYMGTLRWYDVKIKGGTGLSADSTNFLRGIIACGGVNFYDNCEISHMPNDGISSYMFQEAHYRDCRCNYNGLTGGGFARNGISNTATWSSPHLPYPEEDQSRILTVTGGQFKHNYEEGIHFGCVPMVQIDGADCRYNLDRGIEGDSTNIVFERNRDNDQIHIHNCLLEGVPGITHHSMTLNDGLNKDVWIGGNSMGGCIDTVFVATCTSEGSVTFTERNRFTLDNTNLTNGCHAIYLNAGNVDLSAGADFRGTHDRSSHYASAISVNNNLTDGTGGGKVTIANIRSDVTFTHAVIAHVSGHLSVDNVQCDTGQTAVRAILKDNDTNISVTGYKGQVNTSGNGDQGFLMIEHLDDFSVDTLTLNDNTPQMNPNSHYPVTLRYSASNRIGKLLSFNNYWHGFQMSYGPGLVSNGSSAITALEQDLPALS